MKKIQLFQELQIQFVLNLTFNGKNAVVYFSQEHQIVSSPLREQHAFHFSNQF